MQELASSMRESHAHGNPRTWEDSGSACACGIACTSRERAPPPALLHFPAANCAAAGQRASKRGWPGLRIQLLPPAAFKIAVRVISGRLPQAHGIVQPGAGHPLPAAAPGWGHAGGGIGGCADCCCGPAHWRLYVCAAARPLLAAVGWGCSQSLRRRCRPRLGPVASRNAPNVQHSALPPQCNAITLLGQAVR